MSLLFPILLVLYEIAAYLSNDMYLPALPSIMHDFHVPEHMVQLTLTTWFVGSMSMQLILGPLSDRYGRRPIIFAGGAVFLVSTFICAIAPNVIVLMLARLIQGTTVCSVVVAGYASIHESLDKKRAIHVLAIMASITILAPAFGPLFGSLVLMLSSWRTIFWIQWFWALTALVFLYRFMPETNPDIGKPLAIRPILQDYFHILTNKIFLKNVLVVCCLFSAMIAWIATGPLLIVNVFHRTEVIFGVVQLIIFSSFIIATRSIKYFMEWFGVERMINIGLTLAAAGAMISLPLTYYIPDNLWYFVAALSAIVFGSGLSMALLQRLAIEACEQQPMGARMAMYSTAFSFFGVLSTILVSIFYNNTLLSVSSIIAAFGLAAIIIKRV